MIKPFRKHRKIKNVMWELTQECSQECIHCCVAKSFQTPELEVQKNILKRILEIKNVTVLVGGGEPLLNPNIYPLLSNHKPLIKRGRIQICTGGRIIDDRFLSFADDCDPVLRISVHSLDGAPSFTNADAFDYMPLLTRLARKYRIVINTCLTELNYEEVMRMISPISSLNIYYWVVFIPLLSGRWIQNNEKYSIKKESLDKVLQSLASYKGKLILDNGILGCGIDPCSWINNMENLYITVDGRVRVCYSNSELLTSNITYKNSMQEIFSEIDVLKGKCRLQCRLADSNET